VDRFKWLNYWVKLTNNMTKIIPHPANAPGDFYVEDGCCTSCGMPFTVAPDLFTALEDGHCFVSKQPTNQAEVHRMTQAFAVQDMGCIRYKGTNRIIKIKLIAMGEGEQCDQLDDADLIALNQEIQADLEIKRAQFK
jgi:ferredoxin